MRRRLQRKKTGKGGERERIMWWGRIKSRKRKL
jgi:hypothetical protein